MKSFMPLVQDLRKRQAMCYERGLGGPARSFGDAIEALVKAETEIRRLHEGLWEITHITGEDLDGAKAENLVEPDILSFAKQAVTDLRRSYDESLEHVKLP
jgi:hypothetical protein